MPEGARPRSLVGLLASRGGLVASTAPAYAALVLLHARNSASALAAGRVPPDLGYGASANRTLQLLQILCLGYLFAVYGLTLSHWQRLRLTRRHLWWSALAVTLVAGAMLPANSSDVLEYLGFGRLVVLYHLNPYLHTYGEITDRFARYVTWDEPMPYGPVVLPLFAAAGALSAQSVWLAIYAVKLAWMVVHLANAWLVDGLAASLTAAPEFALFLFAFNPLILLEQPGNGHNDGLLILCGLLALTATLRGRTAFGLWLAFLGALVKTCGLFLVAGLVCCLMRRRDWRGLLYGGGASLALGAAVATALPGCWSALTVMDTQWQYSENSLHTLAIDGVRALTGAIGHAWAYGHAFRADRLFFAAVFVALGVWRLASARDLAGVIREVGRVLLLLLFGFAASVSPWYVTWLLPFAALTDSGRLRRTCLVATASVIALYAFPYALFELAPRHAIWSALRLTLALGAPIGFWLLDGIRIRLAAPARTAACEPALAG